MTARAVTDRAMTARAMTGESGGALGPGAISIVAELADERVCSVRVRSSRPVHLTRLFHGRPAREIAPLAGRLFSLCGAAHAFAASRAIAAARGEEAKATRRSLAALECERLSEALRALATMADEAASLEELRALFALTRELAAAGESGERSALAHRLRAGAAQLGLPDDPASVDPAEDRLFGRLWRAFEDAPPLSAGAPDALRAEDDSAVLNGIREAGERFAAAPSLPGRAPETGPFARHWRETDLSRGASSARFRARMIDLARGIGRLESEPEDDSRSAAPAAREGFSAVATARGQLYHWTRLSADDRIADYAIVAPTEWNFHPAGPFVAALLGARIRPAEAHSAIARLAGLFDPCVGFRVEIREAAHA